MNISRNRRQKKNRMIQEHIPLKRLRICSNTIIGGGNVLTLGEKVPLRIGKGAVPVVSIYSLSEKKEWKAVVEQNVSNYSEIIVTRIHSTREIMIGTNTQRILYGRMITDDICEIDWLDLRPLGLNVHGNSEKLDVAGNVFSKNVIEGTKTMIAMG